jgi:hypothetical protein
MDDFSPFFLSNTSSDFTFSLEFEHSAISSVAGAVDFRAQNQNPTKLH